LNRKSKARIVPVREPNGRMLRSVETEIDARSPAEARRLRDAACRGMARPEWGTELGRLFLAGKIGPKLYETGKRWAGLVEAYRRATGAPPPAPSVTAFIPANGSQPADPDSEEGSIQAARDQRIVKVTEEALAVLRIAGVEKERAVRLVCERGEALVGEQGMRNFILGLGWLAQHWGLIDMPALDTRKKMCA
jgi:hypothetical protein